MKDIKYFYVKNELNFVKTYFMVYEVKGKEMKVL